MINIPALNKAFNVYGSSSIYKFKESNHNSNGYELFIYKNNWIQLNSIREEDSVWWYIKGGEWEYVDELSLLLNGWSSNINDSFMNVGISAKRAAYRLKEFSRVTENKCEVTGNKRNGTLDRRQAFGKLF